jgi:hypothetical protein
MVGGEVIDQRTPGAPSSIPSWQNLAQNINSSWSLFKLAKPSAAFRRSYDSFITSLSCSVCISIGDDRRARAFIPV